MSYSLMFLEEGSELVSMESDCRSWVMGKICHRDLKEIEGVQYSHIYCDLKWT